MRQWTVDDQGSLNLSLLIDASIDIACTNPNHGTEALLAHVEPDLCHDVPVKRLNEKVSSA